MNKRPLLLLLCASLAWPMLAHARDEPVSSTMATVDWPAFLHRNDMVWPTLPDNWNNAPFIGDGSLGAILWQNKSGDFHVEVSRSDLYDHRRISAGYGVLFATERLPNGNFSLAFSAGGQSAAPVTGTMRLNLWDAQLEGEISAGDAKWSLAAFASTDPQVLVVQIKPAGNPGRAHLTWQPDISGSTRSSAIPAGYFPYPPQVSRDVDGVHVSVQEMPEDPRYHTDRLGVGQYATAWSKTDATDGSQLFLISTQITYPGANAANQAVAAVRNAQQAGLERLQAAHRQWWHSFYNRSFLSVPDAGIESFYWIQMYKMGSASREGGPVIDLMGPWFMKTNWPAIWWNLNIQLTYWPFYMSNHLAEAEPLGQTLWSQRSALAQNAAPFSSDSYAIGRATGPGCRENVGREVGNLPWAMHNLWLYYRATMDDVFLRDRLFPLMKGSFRYLRHIAIEQPDGKLGLPPTASPEYINAVPNCSYTLACFRWLAEAILQADARLKTHDPIAADCRDVIKRLAPYPVDPVTGIEVGEGVAFTHSHRHWSHLFMIYPFGEWDWQDPAHRPLMMQSLLNWTSRPSAFRGFSWVGAASMWAAAGDGDRALQFLQSFLAKSALPNTMYREGNPVIESPLACARSIQELLLSSSGDRIRVFPAVPSKWADVSFADMRADGAFLISAQRTGGVTRWVTVKSLAGEPCRISTGINGKVAALPANEFSLTPIDRGAVEVNLAKGQTVTLYDATQAPPAIMSATPVDRAGSSRPWGRDTAVSLPVSPRLQTGNK